MFKLRTAVIGIAVLAIAAGAIVFAFGLDQRTAFLPGATTSGHQVFEASCQSCHQGFQKVSNDTCNRCHEAELAQDIHGLSKFRDPRWATYLEELDVLTCTTCHAEHMPAFVRGVTIPPDLCMSCHDQIIDANSSDRLDSHMGFTPDGCWTAGCHNYHDHRSVSTGFLRANLDQPNWLPEPERLEREIVPQVTVAASPDLNRELWGN